jgi:enoyl-CoA hydratase
MNYADFQFLLFENKPNGVLLITITKAEVMNATNARLHWELTKVWGVVNDDPKTKVAVITGAGDQAFSAGGDLDWVGNMVGNPKEIANTMTEAADVVYNMMACDKPIISAINGVAVGAGLAVAFLADISIMAEEAKVTDGHVKIGVAAGDHAAILWPLLCGMAKAKYYLMTAEFVNGKEAERIGLVSLCVPRAELMDKAMAVANKLANGSQQAIRFTKRSLNGWMNVARPIFESSLAMEMLCFLGEDAKEGVASVREKRAPKFPRPNWQEGIPHMVSPDPRTTDDLRVRRPYLEAVRPQLLERLRREERAPDRTVQTDHRRRLSRHHGARGLWRCGSGHDRDAAVHGGPVQQRHSAAEPGGRPHHDHGPAGQARQRGHEAPLSAGRLHRRHQVLLRHPGRTPARTR